MQNYDNCGIFPIILQREQKIKMQLEPKDLYAKLEFDKVLELLEKECLGELGKEAIHSIKVETELKKIKRKLKEVYEYTLTFEYNNPFILTLFKRIIILRKYISYNLKNKYLIVMFFGN